MWLQAIVVLLLIVILIFLEYQDHDCLNGKKCWHFIPSADGSMSIDQMIATIQEMINSFTWITLWRQALLVALIVCIPVIYFITRQDPTWFQILIVVLLVSIGCFFSQSWIWTHYTLPNSMTILHNLQILHDKINS